MAPRKVTVSRNAPLLAALTITACAKFLAYAQLLEFDLPQVTAQYQKNTSFYALLSPAVALRVLPCSGSAAEIA